MVTTSPSIVAWAFTMHAFTMHTGCVQLHGQILEFKRMVGDLLLNPLLTRTDKTNAEVSGRSHHRWTGRRLAKGTLRISVMGDKALKERIVGNELVTPIRSAFEFYWLIFLAASAPASVLFFQVRFHWMSMLWSYRIEFGSKTGKWHAKS